MPQPGAPHQDTDMICYVNVTQMACRAFHLATKAFISMKFTQVEGEIRQNQAANAKRVIVIFQKELTCG